MADEKQTAGFIGKFTVLNGAARELWIAFALKLLNYAAYAVTNLALKRWLSTELGYSDTQALGIVAIWSLAMTVVTLMVGSLTDAIGLRKTFFLSVWVCLGARAVMVCSTESWIALAFGLFPLAIGEALGTPVLVAAIRQYSTTRQRSVSFSLSYAMLNVGGFFAGYIFDGVRHALGEHGFLLGTSITTYRTLFLVSWVIQLSMLPLIMLVRKGAEVTDEGVKFSPDVTKWQDSLAPLRKALPMLSSNGRIGRGTFWAAIGGLVLFTFLLKRVGLSLGDIGSLGEGGWATVRGVTFCAWLGLCVWICLVVHIKRWHDLNKSGWWAAAFVIPGFKAGDIGSNEYGEAPPETGIERLLAFLMLIAFLKLIFMQMYYVFPEFGIRELGEGAPVGALWSINSLLIIFLVPIVGVFTQRHSAYWMVTLGGVISALSVFIMALPTAWFQPLADGWFGHFVGWYLGLKGNIHPYYPMIAIYVIVLSFGEAFYSPRVYEYAAAIAPKGKEGSYGALSYVPFLLAKLLIGIFSGTLLAKYCPAVGERHSETMWLAIAMFASIAPIGLFALRKYIRVREAGRQD